MKITILKSQQPCNKRLNADGAVIACNVNGVYEFKNDERRPSVILKEISNDPKACWIPCGYCTVAERGWIVPASYIVKQGLAADADACRCRAFTDADGRTLVTRQKENFAPNGLVEFDMDSGRWNLE